MRKQLALLLALLLLGMFALPAMADLPFAPQDEEQRHQQAVRAFMAAAFGAEIGDRGERRLRRWETPIRVSLEGDYMREDSDFLDQFLAAIADKVEAYGITAFPGIERVQPNQLPNMRIVICPYRQMRKYMEGVFQPDNWGLFEFWHRGDAIYRANITVASDLPTQRERNHLLMEEMVGAMGLPNDIDFFSDSIVFQDWTDVQRLSDVDWLMLSYLYSDFLQPGMAPDEAREALSRHRPHPLAPAERNP